MLEDAKRRLKLSHHPEGFLQFSGHGVVSGRDAEGHIRGIGVKSWPLYKPTLGAVVFQCFLVTGRMRTASRGRKAGA